MASTSKHLAVLLVLVIFNLSQSECRRGGSGGGRRTTPRTHTTRYTTQYYQPQRQNNSFYHQQTNTYQTGNSNPLAPSAPVAPPPAAPNPPAIGFDNVHQQVGHNSQPGIGFENVHGRVPPQNGPPNQNIGFNVPGNQPPNVHPPLNGGYQPQGAQNAHAPPYNGYNPQPGQNYNPQPGSNYNPQPGQAPFGGGGYQPPNLGGYQPQNPQFGGGYHPQPGYGGYQGNQGLNNPGTYYNPHFGAPNGPPPPIYQPVQQSGGGLTSVLGYAGTFAGGYLIGRLTSGGGGAGGGGGSYDVHHYYNNNNGVPKQTSVSSTGLVTCPQNETQNLCAPNTFPICLNNGTIMCVTHSPYTVPCGSNSSMSCVISVLPCASNDTSCNNATAANATTSTTVVYIPCISNVTVMKRGAQVTANATGNSSSQPLLDKDVKLCVTAIAERKKTESGVGSLLAFLGSLAGLPFEDMNATTARSNIGVNSTWAAAANKTENVPAFQSSNSGGNSTIVTTMSPVMNATEPMQLRTVQVGAENSTEIVNGTSSESSKIITTTENVPVTTTMGIPVIKSS